MEVPQGRPGSSRSTNTNQQSSATSKRTDRDNHHPQYLNQQLPNFTDHRSPTNTTRPSTSGRSQHNPKETGNSNQTESESEPETGRSSSETPRLGPGPSQGTSLNSALRSSASSSHTPPSARTGDRSEEGAKKRKYNTRSSTRSSFTNSPNSSSRTDKSELSPPTSQGTSQRGASNTRDRAQEFKYSKKKKRNHPAQASTSTTSFSVSPFASSANTPCPQNNLSGNSWTTRETRYSSMSQHNRNRLSNLRVGLSQNDLDENSEQPSHSSSAAASASTANNNSTASDPGPARSAFEAVPATASQAAGESTTSGEENDVNRLRELLESRGIPPHLLGALGPRMQHFLHRYVSIGGVPNLSNGNHSKAHQLLEGLQSNDETEQLQSVMEMCQTLVMGNEDSLAGFPFKAVVPVLVTLLTTGGATDGSTALGEASQPRQANFEIMHNACRALTYMMEALPRSSSLIAESIPKFVDKLESIQCMDVAEQSLSALEMLSKRHAKAILHANGVSNCLQYLDFFSLNAQRSALTITSNCCGQLTAEDWSLIGRCVPLLAQRLSPDVANASADRKSVECVCTAMSRIVEAFQGRSDILKQLAPSSTLSDLQTLLLQTPPLLSTASFVVVIRMLGQLCQGCPQIACELLESGVATTLRHLLVGPEPNGRADKPELLGRSPQELFEITSLMMELMPRLPADDVFTVDPLLYRDSHLFNAAAGDSDSNSTQQVTWRWQDDNLEWQPYSAYDSRVIECVHSRGEDEIQLGINGKVYMLYFSTMREVNEESGTSRVIDRVVTSVSTSAGEASGFNADEKPSLVRPPDARLDLVQNKPEVIENFVSTLMSVLYEVYASCAGATVKHRCLRASLRMIYYADANLLAKILRPETVSGQLSQMLSTRNDLHITVMALQLVEILMRKLPMRFVQSFSREGVVHMIGELAAKSPAELPAMSSPALEQNDDEPEDLPGSSNTGGGSGFDGRNQDQQVLFGQLKIPDMLKRKRTCLSSTANDKTKRSASNVSARRIKSPSSAAASSSELRRNGPATRSRLSVHDREADSGDSQQTRFASSGDSASSQVGTSSPLASRFPVASSYASYVSASPGTASGSASVSVPAESEAAAQSSKKSATSGSSSSSSGSSGFLATLNPVKWRWGHSQSSHQSTASSSHTEKASLATPSTSRANHEVRHKVKIWIHEQALSLNTKYFTNYQRQLSRTTLERLESAVALIQAGHSDGNGKLLEGLKQIREVLDQGDVSSFELIHSGMIAAMLKLFETPGTPSFVSNTKMLLHVFASIPLNLNSAEASLQSGPYLIADAKPLETLVCRLNTCISQLEQFTLKVNDIPGGLGVGRGSPSVSALKFFNTHQLKCNLERHPACSNLKQWKNGPVNIDPLALVQAIERYLVVRGYGRLRDEDDCGSEEDNSEDEMDESLLAPAGQGTASRHRLQFLIGDIPLAYNMTVYQAILQNSMGSGSGCGSIGGGEGHSEADMFEAAMGDGAAASAAIWTQTHTIYYRPAVNNDDSSQNGVSSSALGANGRKKSAGKGIGKKHNTKDELWNDGVIQASVNPIDEILSSGSSYQAKIEDPSRDMLSLLRVLYALNEHWALLYSVYHFRQILAPEAFLNPKLSNKALRQLQDPLALITGNIPVWTKLLSAFSPFVMPFETRHTLFYSTCFDRDRAFQRLMESSPELSAADSSERVTPRLDRKKRTVNREDLLKQAELVFNDLNANTSKPMLEIQYENEVGSGLGPTLEFYALVSRELQRADLEMWRNQLTGTDRALYQKTGGVRHVFAPGGLYPAPIARTIKASQLNRLKTRFRMCGKFVAKALMDSRLLDMHFSIPMFKWILGQEKTLCLSDLKHIDESLHLHLCKMQALVDQRDRLISQSKLLSPQQLNKNIEKLTFDGSSVELLGLDFSLPGYDNFELRKGGNNMAVTIHNLDQYVKLVVYWTLIEGVRRQMEWFREGFESIFPMDNLTLYFSPGEMQRALCGEAPKWTLEILKDSCKVTHGFTLQSPAIANLFDIMSDFDEHERRQFLLFATGSPRLPVGGFKSLVPPLTIVRKTMENDTSADEYLPSVMTCANYLKLPDYSSKSVMKEKLLMAQSEGQGSFHLS